MVGEIIMQPQLKAIPTLHDMAIAVGGHYDKADPKLGIPDDHYVLTLDELARLIGWVKLLERVA